MHATVFRVVTISDLWEENWIHAESSWVPEVVSVVLNSSGRKNVCRRGRNQRFAESTENELPTDGMPE